MKSRPIVFNHFGIIGFGNMGVRYLKILKSINKKYKVTIIRSKRKKNKKFEKEADFITNSIKKAVKHGMQCAIICSPASQHVADAKALVKQKIHFLMEKPISNKTEEIVSLIKLTKKNKIKAEVGYVLKELKSYTEIKRKIEKKNISSVYCEALSYLPDWRKEDYKTFNSVSKSLGGGALLELSHEIDYIRNLFGEIKYVSAFLIYSKNLKINVESGANIIFVLKNNLSVSLLLNFDSKINSRKCRINFENDKLTWDIKNDKILKEDLNLISKKNSLHYMYIKQVKRFIVNLNHNKKPLTTLENAYKTLFVAKAAFKSFKLKRQVKVI